MLAGLALLLCALTAALAGNFPPLLVLGQETLAQIGQGTARYARIIPVYDAALYATPAVPAAQLLDPAAAKRLEIVYRVAIKAGDLVHAAERILARQHPQEWLARWRPQLDELHAGYRDVQQGDRYTLTYLPAQGLWLEFNGERIITLPDAEFASLYFGIWLGEKPLSEPLREQLVSAAGSTALPATGNCTRPADLC
jgi:hypothetical protein